MTTAKRLIGVVGQRGLLKIDELTVLVEVVDGRTAWGNEQLQVKPAQGSGRQWVAAERVALLDSRVDEVA